MKETKRLLVLSVFTLSIFNSSVFAALPKELVLKEELLDRVRGAGSTEEIAQATRSYMLSFALFTRQSLNTMTQLPE